MGSQTPFYAFPYPLGTDRVADGDNAIQSLAEKIEQVLGKGTGAATRAWGTPYPADNDFTANAAYVGLISGTLTACPVGAVVLTIWVAKFNTPAVANALVKSRITSAGITWLIVSGEPITSTPSATRVWGTHTGVAIGTVSIAAPTVTVEGLATGGGNCTIGAGSALQTVRIA